MLLRRLVLVALVSAPLMGDVAAVDEQVALPAPAVEQRIDVELYQKLSSRFVALIDLIEKSIIKRATVSDLESGKCKALLQQIMMVRAYALFNSSAVESQPQDAELAVLQFIAPAVDHWVMTKADRSVDEWLATLTMPESPLSTDVVTAESASKRIPSLLEDIDQLAAELYEANLTFVNRCVRDIETWSAAHPTLVGTVSEVGYRAFPYLVYGLYVVRHTKKEEVAKWSKAAGFGWLNSLKGWVGSPNEKKPKFTPTFNEKVSVAEQIKWAKDQGCKIDDDIDRPADLRAVYHLFNAGIKIGSGTIFEWSLKGWLAARIITDLKDLGAFTQRQWNSLHQTLRGEDNPNAAPKSVKAEA